MKCEDCNKKDAEVIIVANTGCTFAVCRDCINPKDIEVRQDVIDKFMKGDGVDMVRVEKTTWQGAGEQKVLYNGPIGVETDDKS